jgi:ribosome maturation factor RimP
LATAPINLTGVELRLTAIFSSFCYDKHNDSVGIRNGKECFDYLICWIFILFGKSIAVSLFFNHGATSKRLLTMENTFRNKIVETIEPWASKFAQDRGLYLLRVQVRGNEQSPVIEIILDGDRSITIDDCQAVSTDIHAAIDSGKLVRGNFRLDVLSPGIEEPLVHDWQFERSISRLVEVHYLDGEETHTLHGHLRQFNDKEIAIEPIHVKARKPPVPKVVPTDEGPVILQTDEQLYDNPVELVQIARGHVTKVIVQAEIGNSGM